MHEPTRLFPYRRGCGPGAGRVESGAGLDVAFARSDADGLLQTNKNRIFQVKTSFLNMLLFLLYRRGRKPRLSTLKMALGGGLASLFFRVTSARCPLRTRHPGSSSATQWPQGGTSRELSAARAKTALSEGVFPAKENRRVSQLLEKQS